VDRQVPSTSHLPFQDMENNPSLPTLPPSLPPSFLPSPPLSLRVIHLPFSLSSYLSFP
jgi:hypothetical protein